MEVGFKGDIDSVHQIPKQYLQRTSDPDRTYRNRQQIERKHLSMDTLYNDYRIQQLLQAYGQWIHDHMAYGWNGFFLSFMFFQIHDSDDKRMEEMKKHL